MHDAFCAFSSRWVSCVWISSESIFGLESVHVNVTIFFKLCVEFLAQFLMLLFGEISKGVGDGLTLLFFGKQRISFWGVGQMFESVLFFVKREVS